MEVKQIESISLGYGLGFRVMHFWRPLAMVEQGMILGFNCLADIHDHQPFLDQVCMRFVLVHEAYVHEGPQQLVLQSSKVVREHEGLLVSTRCQHILQHLQG